MASGHGGARPGAGRKPKQLDEADAATALLTAAVYELAIGQSSVELAAGARGEVRPTVKVYGRDAKQASSLAQELFDELVIKYVRGPSEAK